MNLQDTYNARKELHTAREEEADGKCNKAAAATTRQWQSSRAGEKLPLQDKHGIEGHSEVEHLHAARPLVQAPAPQRKGIDFCYAIKMFPNNKTQTQNRSMKNENKIPMIPTL